MTPKPIRFSDHALLKFRILKAHGVNVDEQLVERIIRHPVHTAPGYKGRQVVQGLLDQEHVLRVIYDETPDELIIVTVYPGRRERYEKGAL